MICVLALIGTTAIGSIMTAPNLATKGNTEQATLFLRQPQIPYYEVRMPSKIVRIERKINVTIADVAKYDWDARTAYAILLAESGGNSRAENLTDYHRSGNCYGSFGLYQLACFRGAKEKLFDKETNILLAYQIWKKEGWQPWSTYLNGDYLKYY